MSTKMEWPLDAPLVSDRDKLVAAKAILETEWDSIPARLREPLADVIEATSGIATRAIDECAALRKRRDDLLEANNRYQQEARDERALVKKGVEATEDLLARIATLAAENERLTMALRAVYPWIETSAEGEKATKIALSALTTEPAAPQEAEADVWPKGCKFNWGDRVTKKSGSSWTGRVCGIYSTSLTPIGYAVESENEPGSVQIYPEAALAAAGGAE